MAKGWYGTLKCGASPQELAGAMPEKDHALEGAVREALCRASLAVGSGVDADVDAPPRARVETHETNCTCTWNQKRHLHRGRAQLSSK